MDELPPLPQYADPAMKFQKRPGPPCAPGVPVLDTATRLDNGLPCCSGCRRLMVVVDGVWVHEARRTT